MPNMQVEAAGERQSSEEQIQTALQLSVAAGQAVNCRLPFQMYFADRRQYVAIRDASWKLTMATATQEDVEQVVAAIGACLGAIARDGAETVMEKLR